VTGNAPSEVFRQPIETVEVFLMEIFRTLQRTLL